MASGVTIIRADKGQDGDYAIALELRLGCADRQAQTNAASPPPHPSPYLLRLLGHGDHLLSARRRPDGRAPPENLLQVAVYGKELRLWHCAVESDEGADCARPLRLQRGGHKRIVAPDGSAIVTTSKPQPDSTLVEALARAWRWQRQLDAGVYVTVSEIGDAENISKSYVSRILRLALLHPTLLRRSSQAGRIRA
jgi:hypothetical protein